MKKLISILVFSLYLQGVGWAGILGNKDRDDDTRLTKVIERGFEVKSNVTIDLSNKYGQVILNSWDRDSVVLKIQITAYGKNDDAVEKMMDRVDFDFNNTANFLTIETVFDRNSGVFKDLWNSVSDASKTLISKSRITVDYEIYVPTKSTVEVVNRFGNIYVNQHGGKLIIDLSHGDFRASNLEAPLDLTLGYGRANIRTIREARINLKGGDLDINRAAQLDLESTSSEVYIQDVSSLRLDSRNDQMRLDEVGYIAGKANFSDIQIDRLFESTDIDLLYGELDINTVMASFSRIRINGRTADVQLNFDPSSNFTVDLYGRQERIILPTAMAGFQSLEDEDDNKNVRISGVYGQGNGSKTVDVEIDNGDLIITLEEPVPYTTKQIKN
jgi:hypothetical protein